MRLHTEQREVNRDSRRDNNIFDLLAADDFIKYQTSELIPVHICTVVCSGDLSYSITSSSRPESRIHELLFIIYIPLPH